MKIRRLAKNTKALSPVIATIILVAVTVAIAIAVAAWLGALTFTYTRTEQIQLTSLAISTATTGATQGQATFGIANSGTSDVSLSIFRAQGGGISGTATGSAGAITGTGCSVTNGVALIPKGGSCSLTVTWTGVTFSSGTRYDFTLVSTQGNPFPTSGIA